MTVPTPDPALAGLRVALRIARRELAEWQRSADAVASAMPHTGRAMRDRADGAGSVVTALERAIARRTRGRA